MQPSRPSRPALLLAALFALAALACFAYPLYVIRPFRYQGATELRIALLVLQIAPWVSILSAIVCAVFVVIAWKQARRWIGRAAAVFCLVLAIAGAVLVRVNIYEKMFHPIATPQFEAASQAHVNARDFVIAVRVNGASRAYPVRQIAYHHVVNDTLAGEPIVATY